MRGTRGRPAGDFLLQFIEENVMADRNYVSRRRVLAAAALAPALVAGAGGSTAAPLSGKAALVTGSSRGIGAATALRLARDGFAIAVNYQGNARQAAAVVEQIHESGGRAIAVQADVSNAAAVAKLFDAAVQEFGGIDVVVSNAGVMRLAPIRDMSDGDFENMMAVNLKGSFFVLREAARRVRESGRIIALSSSITQLRSPAYGPYAATKSAQEILVNVLAKELAGRMISVNAVAPGVTNTPLFTEGKSPQQIAGFADRTPHKRLGEPADIADVIAMLCSRDGQWINGQTVFANGGLV
jgi:3-oxoacyl-[acyl-carrier protein] reductase